MFTERRQGTAGVFVWTRDWMKIVWKLCVSRVGAIDGLQQESGRLTSKSGEAQYFYRPASGTTKR